MRSPWALATDYALLSATIYAMHTASKETYGDPCSHAGLAEKGTNRGRNRLAPLVKAVGWKGVARWRLVTTAIPSKKLRPVTDLVDRNFTAEILDQF